MGSPNQSEALRSPILAVISGGGVTNINVFQKKCWAFLRGNTSESHIRRNVQLSLIHPNRTTVY